MDEGGVDHGIRGGGAFSQAIQILQRTAMDFRARRLERGGARVGTRQPQNLVPRAQQFLDDGRTDETGGAGTKTRIESSRFERSYSHQPFIGVK